MHLSVKILYFIFTQLLKVTKEKFSIKLIYPNDLFHPTTITQVKSIDQKINTEVLASLSQIALVSTLPGGGASVCRSSGGGNRFATVVSWLTSTTRG